VGTDSSGKGARDGLRRSWSTAHDVPDDGPHRRTRHQFLWRQLLGGSEHVTRLRVPVPLNECARRINAKACPTLRDSEPVQVDGASVLKRSPGVPTRDGNVHSVQQDIRWAEGGPAVVAVYTKELGRAIGFVKEFERAGAIPGESGRNRSS
jgi:hypothetical protein